eukprot:CAMPEP_0177617706 /NCGR_PEP_ID=MMETSP0419_2-20121207/25082_1 /TAXON_ID=582737 /ORGANISM="Tetraselmis sp., Strain GSL018" /LENGTH=122 /DNA_ID=CAMNT_0019116349 /DNA_START=63 /DNA_END=432 /DNA_ORIENTATION=+
MRDTELRARLLPTQTSPNALFAWFVLLNAFISPFVSGTQAARGEARRFDRPPGLPRGALPVPAAAQIAQIAMRPFSSPRTTGDHEEHASIKPQAHLDQDGANEHSDSMAEGNATEVREGVSV